MKKNQFKQAALLGLGAAALLASGSVEGTVLESSNVILAHSCGAGSCNGQGTSNTNNRTNSQVALEDAKPAAGHSCNGASGAKGATGAAEKSGNGCAGKTGGSCNAKSGCSNKK